jgi:predicted phage terminase large subunit-like protein
MWGRAGVNAYLLEELVAILSFTETISAIRAMLDSNPEYRNATLLIEKKANGHAILNVLKSSLANVKSYSPKDSKAARLVSCTPAIEAGQVWVPDERWWTWVVDTLNEWCAFPRGRYDDRVDTLSMVLIHWFGRRRSGASTAAIGPRLE